MRLSVVLLSRYLGLIIWASGDGRLGSVLLLVGVYYKAKEGRSGMKGLL